MLINYDFPTARAAQFHTLDHLLIVAACPIAPMVIMPVNKAMFVIDLQAVFLTNYNIPILIVIGSYLGSTSKKDAQVD